MGYLLKFGDYVLPDTLRPDGQQNENDTAPATRPRAPGARSQVGRLEPTVLRVTGELTADTAAALDTLVKALRTNLLTKGKQAYYHGTDTRYYKAAQCKSISTSHMEGRTWDVVTFVTITFVAEDYPLAFDCTAVSEGITLAGETHNNTGGEVFPAWVMVVGTGGTGPITITNTATGEAMKIGSSTVTLTGGDEIIADRDGYSVTVEGVADASVIDGRIPRLLPGNNPITVAYGGTATLSTLTLQYKPTIP